MGRISHSLTPLLAQLATILIASVTLVGIVVLTATITNHRTDNASHEADAALITALIDTKIETITRFLDQRTAADPVDLATALDVNDAMLAIDKDGADLVAKVNSTETREIDRLARQAQASLRAFFVSKSPSDLNDAVVAVRALDGQLAVRVDEFAAQSDDDQAAVKGASHWSLLAIILTCIVTALIVAATSAVIGQRQRRALSDTRRERDELAALTKAIQKRDQQFAALYQVVTEITDNLSMRYVVNTAVSEAARLVEADYAELRLLENDALTPRGVVRDGEIIPADGGALPLGIGLAGKAAKRGRTVRLDAGAAAVMADDERVEGMESGLVVPLIVGARVVGTLACWSLQVSRFDSEDEHILELMASQVATAVAAADLHASSEQKASHDALTGLPNRRRLADDTAGFQQDLEAGARMAVAMFDIDHFKRFNDDFGHKVGDVTLQKVAEVMRGSVRDSDHLYRYGGEEFLLVLTEVDAEEAVQLVERVRRAVERTILTGENLEPVGPVTISAGVARAPENGDDFTVLTVFADEALYKSKENGRNRVTLAEPNVRLANAA